MSKKTISASDVLKMPLPTSELKEPVETYYTATIEEKLLESIDRLNGNIVLLHRSIVELTESNLSGK